MEIHVIKTSDHSHTLFVPSLNEPYHSVHGAIQESVHVFINAGLFYCKEDPVSLLEIGFGTGLNAYLTYLETQKNNRKIHYESIEKYPVPFETVKKLNYPRLLNEQKKVFEQLHLCLWEQEERVSDFFYLRKRKEDLRKITFQHKYHLVYFDAFSPDVQPDMWTEEIFTRVYEAMYPNGTLVTYSAKGKVKRALEKSGWRVEKLPGPPGKREIIRAVKK